MSIDSLKHRKLSFGLTILGIVIGISAIVGLVSIGEGLKFTISDLLEQFGSENIMVMSSFAGGMPGTALLGEGLKDSDVEKIEKIRDVDLVIGMLVKTLPVEYKNNIVTTYVMGLPAKKSKEFFSDMQAFKLREGRYFKENEDNVAVLGVLAADELFDKEIGLGDNILVKEKSIKVIGILKSIGSNQDDQSVMLPLDTLRDVTGSDEALTMMFVKASDSSKVDSVAEAIEKKLDKEYGEDAFMAMTNEQVMESIGSIFSVVTFVIGGIASISMIVAGVGISNTMLTSVVERTREIGVMKAIGATNYNILEIFLIESAILGLLGGVIGCVVGIVLSELISIFAVGMLPVTFKTLVTPEIIMIALTFSVLVGVASGIFPARRASKLQPVEALRYE